MHLSPTYDMVSTSVYATDRDNPPSIEFVGQNTWTPGP